MFESVVMTSVQARTLSIPVELLCSPSVEIDQYLVSEERKKRKGRRLSKLLVNNRLKELEKRDSYQESVKE